MLKEKIKSDVCIGTFLKLPQPDIVHILSQAGFDFIICDTEHAQITETEVKEIITAGMVSNIPIIIRYPDPNQGVLNRFLEMGAAGIQVPRVSSVAQTEEISDMMNFPPIGKRSFGNANILAKYGQVPVGEHIENENNRLLTVVQFESADLERPLDKMMEHIDVAFIGPVDLSIDLGEPMSFENEEFLKILSEVEASAASSNTTLGAFAATTADLEYYLGKGYKYIALSGDISLLSKSANALIKEVKNLL